MANSAAMGTSFSAFGLEGELFIANPRTPLLNAIGGLNAGKTVGNLTFSVGVNAALETASAQALTEAEAAAAVTPITYVGDNLEQQIQLMRRDLSLSTLAQSARGRVQNPEVATSGLAFGDRSAAVSNLANLDEQVAVALKQVALDYDYSILNGVYAKSTSASVAGVMRGAVGFAGVNTAAGTTALSKDWIYTCLAAMSAAGAEMQNLVFVGNSFQIKGVNTLYGYAPPDRQIGGVNVSQVFTQFGPIGVMWEPQCPAATLFILDMAFLAPVFLPTPGGNKIEVSPLAKVAAADTAMVYTQCSIDHGPSRMHGKISGLTTS
jgi:hypothetical protein